MLLEFEHIIQVNDLSNKAIAVLTRNQLWQGLVLRARNPDKFNHALQCKHEELEENEFIRTVQAGGTSFCERVTLSPEQKICTKTVPDFDQINAQSITSIEEPQTDSLFVRFHYKRDLDVIDEGVDVGEHLKAAYVRLDRDAIAIIRMLADVELFDKTIN